MSSTPHRKAPALDFSTYVAERTRFFSGREWVFEKIDEWLADGEGSRYFLLTGKVGSGKTAISARLKQFSDGAATPPPALARMGRGVLSAAHFCSASDASWIDPLNFTRSVAVQLAARHQEFARALADIGEKTINIRVDFDVERAESGANMTGVVINNLDVSGMNARDAFNRTVLDPLRAAYDEGFAEPINILVDALDESLSHEGEPKIVHLLTRLQNLSPRVRFILTGREDARVEGEFLGGGEGPDGLFISGEGFSKHNETDVDEYVRRRLTEDEALQKKLADFSPKRAASLPRLITAPARGNFQYVSFVLEGVALGHRSLSDLRRLPPGLFLLYHDALKRLAPPDGRDWSKKFAPVVGVLSVAQESVFRDQLESFAGNVKSVADVLSKFRQFIEATGGGNGRAAGGSAPATYVERYRLYHQSVNEFLRRRAFDVDAPRGGTKSVDNAYFLPAEEWHGEVADFYMPPKLWAEQLVKFSKNAAAWLKWNNYGLRHVPTHLAEAAGGLDRHEQTERLVRLVLNPNFQQTHRARVGDLSSLGRSLDLALRAAALDDDPAGFPLVLEMAYGFLAFRRAQLRPEQVFEMARKGDVAGAERQLTLFDAELEWQHATLLAVAWLAAAQNPQEAQRLLDNLARNLAQFETLGMFHARVRETFGKNGVWDRAADSLPPPSEVAALLVIERMGGLVDPSGIEMLVGSRSEVDIQRGMELLSSSQAPYGNLLDRKFAGGPEEGALYLAAQDGPILTSYAVADREKGTEQLKKYLAIHAGNSYATYRNRSLWFILDSVLRHPDNRWAQEMAETVLGMALAGGNREFAEGVPITLLGLLADAGAGGASKNFKAFVEWALVAPRLLSHNSDTEGDSWGTHRRRFASLAETMHILAGDSEQSRDLIRRALNLPFGFAGFQAPANLMVAEAARICGLDVIQQVLGSALSSAHNIQDLTFCARTTARVNAMDERWWKAYVDVSLEIPRFQENRGDVTYTSLHRVGEQYARRNRDQTSAPLPGWMRDARTLRDLSKVYSRPLSDFERLNRGLDPDAPLPDGLPVNVPDPGFAPLLACRLSAETLVSPALIDQEKVNLIQRLVPAAASNATALDTVMSRLLLAARPDDKRLLSSLMETARECLLNQSAGSQEGLQKYI